jgi:hypothetical protein
VGSLFKSMEWPTFEKEGRIPFYRLSPKEADQTCMDSNGHVRPKAGYIWIPMVKRMVGHVRLEAQTCPKMLTGVRSRH